MFKITKRLTVLFFLLLFAIYCKYTFEFCQVYGTSMLPSIKQGDYLLIYKGNRHFKRGDVVIVKMKDIFTGSSYRVVKRVIGLPNETLILEKHSVSIIDKTGQIKTLKESWVPWYEYNNCLQYKKVKIASDEIFIMGDNRYISYDSRKYGPVNISKVEGKVLVILCNFPSMQFEE